jgi:hypothetical protein
LPSPYHFFRVVEGVVLNAFQPPVTLNNGVTATNTIPPCQSLSYSVDVPVVATFATNTVVFASAPVNVWFNQTNYPTGSALAGDILLIANATNGSSFVLSSTSAPPLVPGATYYLSVQNPCANGGNVTVALRLDFELNLVTLTNGVPYLTANPGGSSATNYYRYIVSGSAARVQFEIDNPGGDMTLFARDGLPLPTLANYDYVSANPLNNSELIVVFTNSTPVPLAPGAWYLSAVNVSGGPVTYGITATEWPVTGLPVGISGAFLSGTNSFCLTWSSLPGVHYYIQAVTNLTGGNWTTIVADITGGPGTSTSWCLPLPSPYHFFRVGEGLVPNPPAPAPGVTRSGGGYLLQWSGPIYGRYQVQWTTSLSSPVWTTLPTIFTSTTGTFSFFDDGSQTAPFGTTRFYRIVVLP